MRYSVSSPDETPRSRVDNTTRSGVFLKNFEEFHLVMKHCVECLISLLKQNDFIGINQRCKNEQFFI